MNNAEKIGKETENNQEIPLEKSLEQAMDNCINDYNIEGLLLLGKNYSLSEELIDSKKGNLIKMIADNCKENHFDLSTIELIRCFDLSFQMSKSDNQKVRQLIQEEFTENIASNINSDKEDLMEYKEKMNCSDDLWKYFCLESIKRILISWDYHQGEELFFEKFQKSTGVKLSSEEFNRHFDKTIFYCLTNNSGNAEMYGSAKSLAEQFKESEDYINNQGIGQRVVLYLLQNGLVQKALKLMESLELEESDLK